MSRHEAVEPENHECSRFELRLKPSDAAHLPLHRRLGHSPHNSALIQPMKALEWGEQKEEKVSFRFFESSFSSTESDSAISRKENVRDECQYLPSPVESIVIGSAEGLVEKNEAKLAKKTTTTERKKLRISPWWSIRFLRRSQ